MGPPPSLTPLPERNLDILRCLAVLCVLASHLLTTWSVTRIGIAEEWAIGHLGVLLFFVHTALVLMASIERYGTDRPGWIRVFYIRRAFRIYPLAVASIVLVTAVRMPAHVPVAGVVAEYVRPSAGTLASNLTLTQNVMFRPSVLGVLWSLPIEVQMYLILPFCYLVASRRRSSPLAALVLFFMGLWLVLNTGAIPHTYRLWSLEFAPCFCGGLIAFHLARRGIRPFAPAILWPLALVAAGGLFFALHPDKQTAHVWWVPCILLGFAIPLIRDARPSLITAIAHRICEVSYSIYLLHVPVLWLSFVVLRFLPLWCQWTTFGLLLVTVPPVAYRFFEQAFIRLGKVVAAGRAEPNGLPEVSGHVGN
jgi:peptidoglycan/LPS O-acetylase OafA/YrhL